MKDKDILINEEPMNFSKENVSAAVIKRLPRYFRYLRMLIREGKTRISSAELSRRMNIISDYYVICKMKNEVDEIKFKEFGIGAKLLYEVPDDCPFKLEHVVYDSTERDKDLEKFRIKKHE